MSNLYHAQVVAAGLVIAALLSTCQAAQNAPVTQATAPTAALAPSPSILTTTQPTTLVAGTTSATAAPTKAPSRYDTLFIQAPSLHDNLLGEKDQRPISVYLPPSYFTSDAHYPVIYYLPGYTDTSMLGFSLPGGADKLMRDGTIQEMIIVVANGVNQLGGSFYVNSPVTGRWEDFIVDDVVGYVDTHYRSVPQASARALSGHSMGGFGALNIAIHHPDVFSTVYSLSPGLFDPNGLGESQMFELEGFITRFLDYQRHIESLPVAQAQRALLSAPDRFTLAYGLAFAPNPRKHPPYLDYPYALVDGKLVRNDALWKQWHAGFGGIADTIRQNKANILRLNGLVIDYGRQDEYAWIPKGCEYLGAQLNAAGIPHELRSYDGSHESHLSERIGTSMLPFLSERLSAE